LGGDDDGDVEFAGQGFEAAGDGADLEMAGLVATGDGDELEIVDQEEVEVVLGHQLASFGADVEEGDGGGVVDPDGGEGELARGLDEEGPGGAVEAAGAQVVEGEAGLRGGEALGDLQAGHFQAEESDVAVMLGGVEGEGGEETGFSEPGTGRDDDEVGGMEAGQELIEGGEGGGDSAGFALFGLVIEFVEVDGEVAEAVAAVAAEGEEGGFDLVEGLLLRDGEIVGQLGQGAGGGEHATAQGGVGDDAGVALGVNGGGDVVDQCGESGGAADVGEGIAAFEFVAQGDEIDGIGAVVESDDGLIDLAVLVDVEIVGPDEGEGVGNGLGVDEEGSEEGLFRVGVVGREGSVVVHCATSRHGQAERSFELFSCLLDMDMTHSF